MQPGLKDEFCKLIIKGGISFTIDEATPSGEWFVQVIKREKGIDKLVNGYYPDVERGIQTCLSELKKLEQKIIFHW